MVNNLNWESVKEFYKDKFGIDGWVVEMYANIDILTLCASGASNKTIENFLEIPEGEVVKVIRDAFRFDGWEEDLPVNPYKMYNAYDGNKSSVEHFLAFYEDLRLELGRYTAMVSNQWESRAQRIFYICETMYDIERKIKDEWI